MQISYAVSWQESDGQRHSGRLELGAEGLSLDGRNGEGSVTRLIRYGEIRAFRLARSTGDRLQGRPTLVLELGDGRRLKVASIAQPGIVAELADRLSSISKGRHGRELEAIVIPIREGKHAEAEALLEAGPPFDPAAFGLTSHDVYVTDREIIFVFEGSPDLFREHLAHDGAVFEAAEAWRPLIDGPIRLGLRAYAWPS
ncbi:MAG TPA: hypothetical protein VH968_13320 [Gaiellaceae bacterium]|jgi:hypothetical protein